jgi:hypothetical protein
MFLITAGQAFSEWFVNILPERHTSSISALTPWRRVIFEKLIVSQLARKFPAFNGTWKFITMYIRTCHWILCWATWIHCTTSHRLTLRTILILSYLNACFSQVACSLKVFRLKFVKNFSSLVRATCFFRFILLLELITLIIFGGVQIMNFVIVSFSPTFCYFLSLRSKYTQHPLRKYPECVFRKGGKQVSHPYKTRRKAQFSVF